MSLSEKTVSTYIRILKEELVVAMGCTEPIAIAYAASVLRHALQGMPERIEVSLSGDIIKNVKSVIVPSTGGMHGIFAAIAAGLVAGCPEKKLEVLTVLDESDLPRINDCLSKTSITVSESEHHIPFEIDMTATLQGNTANIKLANRHTNITGISLNGEDVTALYCPHGTALPTYHADRALLNVEDIVTFAKEAPLDEIAPLLRRQIDMNMAIAKKGLEESFGASIGRIIYSGGNCSLRDKARAYAAAGSDARMSGCELPVAIISGSGNQGITTSVPVVIHAQAMGSSEEALLRALLVSDLITIHLKTGIGCLSAYCGAISAGCGCGCGICYLNGGGFNEIAHTLVNALAILSGTICDGAKASCAAKIAMAVEAGIMGYEMMKAGKEFVGGDGIVTKGVENTIRNIGKLARDGMLETDREIIRIMLGE